MKGTDLVARMKISGDKKISFTLEAFPDDED